MRAFIIAVVLVALAPIATYTDNFHYYCWWRPYEWREANSYCDYGPWHAFYGAKSPRQFWHGL